MSVVSNNILAGASGQGGTGYEIERSLRFNPVDTPRLSKTFASTNNTFTASFWLKRSSLATGYQHIFSSTGSSSCSFEIVDNVAYLYNQAHQTSSVYLRDPSAWYHIVLSVTAGTCTLYINNSQVLTGITGFSYGASQVMKLQDERSAYNNIFKAAVAAGVLIWGVFVLGESDPFVTQGPLLLIGVAAMIITGYALRETKPNFFVGCTPLVWLGKRSYAIYFLT